MPPKAKFTREEIVDMALRMTKEHGIDAVTARELGNRLGSSARPIFTVFESMDEVRELVIRKAKELYGQYVEEGLQAQAAFRGVGMAYIRFAMEQPKLFALLFMRAPKDATDVSNILPVIEEHYERILQSVKEAYGVGEEVARKLYQHLWIYSHGIAAMLATGLCGYTPAQVEEQLTDVFRGLLGRYEVSVRHERDTG